MLLLPLLYKTHSQIHIKISPKLPVFPAVQVFHNIPEVEKSACHVTANEQLEGFQKYLKVYLTAVFWMEFLQMCDILHQFNCYEREGNLAGHLSESGKMLPYLTAAGHYKYGQQSLTIYLRRNYLR